MRVGVPKEIKDHEDRVGLVPSSVRELAGHGHEVLVETGAGRGIGVDDEAYRAAGARIVDGADEVFATADMIVKVKEPQAVERRKLREGQILFTYLHLAPDPDQARDLMASGATCIAYETVTAANGSLPLLAPMSEVAGRMAPQVGAHCLENAGGGMGVLLGGVPGVLPAEVVILGGGVAGTNAAQVAIGLGADVTVVDRSLDVLRRLVATFGSRVKTAHSNADTIGRLVTRADLVISTVLVPGAAAPKLVTREHVAAMKTGSVLVDVAIDQGGAAETSRATTHSNPTYVVDGVVHYCVANMPGGVARTSAFALNNATLPFTLAIADKGWKRALAEDRHLAAGLNVHAGRITYKAVADALGFDYRDTAQALAA
ncbi:alanine dehydrogenase [Oharaeibacter diazotrophicus]|uniref:Alanine dehydrogenase n=1 Tax=Oharaeibacter diazotrophicus TaxID=1920512 RepID=A0A4R6RCE4_9HYPH|nr:alanine dehydrogenase [Oharaeibacter diazotrophicus]TDP83346.1 alanine dehydrogenase [Oharaeibacter diazotrophicus]BBE72179.1 alanine dehydrogenase [Pleomorphomonas sp. SM30]GLS78946.1 alanine dehydrogenase [Oharaeibacter diazotrophicus]